MDNDLDRSVRFLEDALRPTGRGLFKTPNKSRLDKTQYDQDLSVTMAPYEIQKIMHQGSKYNDTMSSILLDTSVRGSVIQGNAPWKNALESLYIEFFEVLQSHSGGHDVLDVLSDLARCASDALKVIDGLKSKVTVTSADKEKWLENERNTWRLLFILYQDRLHTQNLMDDDETIQYFGKSEKYCVENLFKRDPLVRESQLVIDWLESTEAERDDEILHFSDATVGWENTLHQLQLPNAIPFSSSRQIVSKMDPDAPHYENRPLHDEDADDEVRLCRRIFREIRCGKLDQAQRLCQQSGHSWKAAIFEGWRLYHNPNIKEGDNEVDSDITDVDDGFEDMPPAEIEGNANRDIWKAMAIKYCKQDYLSLYDKASIGVFCGYIDPILSVCKTWEDNLWAYMKGIVDIRVESEVRDCVVRNNSYSPLPEEYWIQRRSLNEVFDALESSKNPIVRDEARKRDHIIQKYIILDEIPKLVNYLEDWAENSMVDTQFLRFAAHLVLFLEQIGQANNRQSVEKIVEAYIRRLTEMNETQMVAYYVSKLSNASQIQLYAMYLENIVDPEERKTSLIYAENSGLNIFAITKQVVENIRSRPLEMEESDNLQVKVTESDIFKIGALDWLNFFEQQRAEFLLQCNAIVFAFLTVGKVECAQKAMEKLPHDIVASLVHQENVDKAIKEHLSYKAYLSACDAFNEWFSLKGSAPLPPEPLPEHAPFVDKVAYQHKCSQYNAEFERWKMGLAQMAKNAKTVLYNVLLFPGGWLCDVEAKDADYLRSVCIPEIVLLLCLVLKESNQHGECVQLADIIASEDHKLYQVYSKEKLGDLLTKLCESSLTLVKANKDPFGTDDD